MIKTLKLLKMGSILLSYSHYLADFVFLGCRFKGSVELILISLRLCNMQGFHRLISITEKVKTLSI
jgi:hypothetical protein